MVMPLRSLAQSTTTVTVDPTITGKKVNPLVFGANHRYIYSGFSMWDAQNNSAYPAFSTAFRNSGITALRFPAGTIGNTYHWQRAIGSLAQRTPNINGGSLQPQTNEFGPDEFARLIQDNSVAGTVVVNFGTGTAQEAADWVEYMNAPVGTNPGGGIAWADVRQSNGRTDPYPITYWEVGNENNSKNQAYWMGAPSNQKYAFGGTTSFVGQRVGKFDDYRDSAAVSNGETFQEFYVKYAPVQPNSQTIYVDGQAWTAVSSLSAADEANVYQIDLETGKIQFGDGIHGNIPPSGSVVTIDYISGPHDGFVDFYKAMKAVDPKIKVCTSYDVILQLKATYPFDCVVTHPYTYPKSWSTVTSFHDNIMLEPAKRAAEVNSLLQKIRNNTGARADNIDVVISEYGIIGYQPGLTPRPAGAERYEATLGGGLYVAQSLKYWLEMGIPVAQKHPLIDFVFSAPPSDSTNVRSTYNAIFSEGPAFVSSATAHVFNLYKAMLGSQLVQSSVTGNPTRILFNGSNLTALQTLASIDQTGSLYLLVINRTRATNVTTSVQLQSYQSSGLANIKTLNGSSYLSYNTPTSPNTVKITEKTIPIGASQFNYTFPAHSITTIKISGAVQLF